MPAKKTSNKGTAVDGGDLWSGSRVTKDELREICDLATSTRRDEPVILQWFPQRQWLWSQWSGTLVRLCFPDVLLNMAMALVIAIVCQSNPHLSGRLGSIERIWVLSSGLISFCLSFFLSQAYTVWRNVYRLTRRVQGRLNDFGLLCASAAMRDEETGAYTPEASELLSLSARYIRLFHVLLYATVTTRFAPLSTPTGLEVLRETGSLTTEERELLLASSQGHNAVITWLATLYRSALHDGRLSRSYSRSLQNALLELRATYATIPDELVGRMPLAYTHLMQVLTDALIFSTPFALVSAAGAGGVLPTVLGTGAVTLFYTSILGLAKMFLDPFDNDGAEQGKAGLAINVETLLQETNIGSDRWRKGACTMPPMVTARGERKVVTVAVN